MTPPEIPTYSAEEARARVEDELPGWECDGSWLRREVRTRSWAEALAVAGRVAYVAEAAHHHPDLEVRADGVLIRVRHHWAAGITDADFELARAIREALA